MQYVMMVCFVANVAQAIAYQRLTGRFQTMFWFLAAFTGLLSFV
jgi:hypothetical protein